MRRLALLVAMAIGCAGTACGGPATRADQPASAAPAGVPVTPDEDDVGPTYGGDDATDESDAEEPDDTESDDDSAGDDSVFDSSDDDPADDATDESDSGEIDPGE